MREKEKASGYNRTMARFVGKFVGTVLGLTLGGPWGGALGLLIGHMNDRKNDRIQERSSFPRPRGDDLFPDFVMSRQHKTLFSACLIVLGAKLAKADGMVSREEVLAFRRIFRTPETLVAEVGERFDMARQTSMGYEPYAARLAQVFGRANALLEEVLAGLFYVAIADSPRLTRAELVFLRRVSVIFGFTEADFARIAGRVGLNMNSAPPPPKKDSAYDVLGLPTTASEDVIKRTYRALLRKHHPDKLLAAGLPADKIAEATEKVKIINAAYAEICKMRDIK